LRAELEEALMLVLAAEAHDVFDPGAVVPTAIEDDDLAAGGELLDVALHEELALLTIRRGWQGNHAKHARADALGEGLDGAALPRRIAAFEHDDDPRAGILHPILQVAKLDLKLVHLLLVVLALQLAVVGFVLPLAGVIFVLRLAVVFCRLLESHGIHPST